MNGVDYRFLTVEEFRLMEERGELLESGIFDGNHCKHLNTVICAGNLRTMEYLRFGVPSINFFQGPNLQKLILTILVSDF